MEHKKILLLIIIFSVFISSCRKNDLSDDYYSEDSIEFTDIAEFPDWNEITHGKDSPFNYDVVFNQNKVLRFDIEITEDNWSTMQSNLSYVLSTGSSHPSQSLDFDDPMYMPCSFKFNDTEWYQVGIRYKGNSSLQSAYNSGNKKLSFKLDFDEFEDYYPEIENQRFYGFKQLNLNNNFDDPSLMREKVGADLFRQFGMVSANTAFCVIYIDYGSGPQYFGVYTIVEEVDDTVYETQFDITTGNLYKPDGDAASFAANTYDTEEMYLKTNEDMPDYSDVRSLYDEINSTLRSSDVNLWKSNVEGIFNVDVFLQWLAANTVIQNWDTYGLMTHNYYLYNNPENGLLTWIPWDNNEAFQIGKNGGALSFSMNEVDDDWPLIRYIIDQDEYKQVYETYLQKFIDEVFIPANMISTYSSYYEMLRDYAYAEEPGCSYIDYDTQFDAAVETLKTHVQTRNNAVNSYMN